MDQGMGEVQGLLKEIMDRISRITPSSQPESYNCDKCHDTEWVEIVDEEGVARQARCSCYKQKVAREMVERSGLSGHIDTNTFDSFITNNPTRALVKEKAQEYTDALVQGMKEKNPRLPWFFIGGNPGSGKTHICTAICGELMKRGVRVKYMQWLNEVRRLKFCTNDDSFEELAAEYLYAPVLYIDDLFKQRYTEQPVFSNADITTAFKILDSRYAQNKPTIISCEWNLVDHLIAYADEGVFSRVYERCRGFMINISRNMDNNFRMTGG